MLGVSYANRYGIGSIKASDVANGRSKQDLEECEQRVSQDRVDPANDNEAHSLIF